MVINVHNNLVRIENSILARFPSVGWCMEHEWNRHICGVIDIFRLINILMFKYHISKERNALRFSIVRIIIIVGKFRAWLFSLYNWNLPAQSRLLRRIQIRYSIFLKGYFWKGIIAISMLHGIIPIQWFLTKSI